MFGESLNVVSMLAQLYRHVDAALFLTIDNSLLLHYCKRILKIQVITNRLSIHPQSICLHQELLPTTWTLFAPSDKPRK